jgi:biotin carboxylase
MFDDATERAAATAGLEIAHPSAELRRRLDSKIVTTRLGNEAASRARRTPSGARPATRS